MIPSYSEDVKIKIVEKDDRELSVQIFELKEELRQIRETVEYINRERSRLKSDLESLKSLINRG